jgi:hypothetical protein
MGGHSDRQRSVRAFKEIAKLVDAKLLFPDARMIRNQNTLMSAQTVSYNIRAYIKFVDGEGKWTAYSRRRINSETA